MTSLARANRIITMCAQIFRRGKPRVWVYVSSRGLDFIRWGMPGERPFA